MQIIENNANTQTENLALDLHNSISGERLITDGISEIARQCASEGIVMLKNNGVLPLRESERVSVFGRCQVDTFMVGYGSGGDIHPPYKVSIIEGLRNSSAVKVNETLALQYETWCNEKDNIADPGDYWGYWPHSYPEMMIPEEYVKEASNESDVALFIIGRAAGEDRGNKLEKGSYYLTDDEKQLLSMVRKHFSKTVLVYNCGNIIDMSCAEAGEYDSVIYMWLAGMEGGNALADILTGKANPSGKLTSKIAKEYSDYPSSENFGDAEKNIYEEDIYVGYRYFETFKPNKILYSFGYGLSYTTFDISVMSCSYYQSGYSCSLMIRNSGEFSGKETVQIYMEAPQGKLGKEHKRLVAFRKTKLLKPGESEIISFVIDRYDMASYDDVGKTGACSAWVIEAGKYKFTYGISGTDGRLYYGRIGEYDQDELEVVERLVPICPLSAPINRFVQEGKDVVADIGYETVPAGNVNLYERIKESIPTELPYSGDKGIKFDDVCAGKANIDDFIAQFTNEELQSLTRGEGGIDRPSGVAGNEGVFGGFFEPLKNKGVPIIVTADGPAGLRIMRYTSLLPCGTLLASTFNEELVKSLYEKYADEMERFSVDVGLAPGMNIMRNPLCGRNFEYFSEDPYLSGKMGSAAVLGIQSKGRAACPKHFATNNQETARYTSDSILSERALREIYLKAFRMCVTQAKPKIVMMCYNKINGVWGHYNFDLASTVLRKEWNYQGMTVTDWWMRKSPSPEFPCIRDNAYRVRAGVDVLMPGNDGPGDGYVRSYDPDETLLESIGKEDGITRDEIHRTARNVLKFCMQTRSYRRD